MQTTQVLTLVAVILTAGWFSAFLTQLFKREAWPSSVKLGLSMVVAALVGTAAAYLTGSVTHFVVLWQAGVVTAKEVIDFAVLIFTVAQVWYEKFMKGQGWAQTLGAIGSK